jgi:hypothetical protein
MAVTGPPRRIGQAQRKNPPGSESNRLAATGAVLLFGGAVIMRLRPGERATIIADLVHLAMAAFVAWGRFGPGSFTRLTQRALSAGPANVGSHEEASRTADGSYPNWAPRSRPDGWFRPVRPTPSVPATGAANRYRLTTDALQAPGVASPEELRVKLGQFLPAGVLTEPLQHALRPPPRRRPRPSPPPTLRARIPALCGTYDHAAPRIGRADRRECARPRDLVHH